MRPFPGEAKPDIVLTLDDGVHICEVKSSRTDYGRFDEIFDSRLFREYLATHGHDRPAPWEVEQDLIKLRLFLDLSPRVKSCMLLLIDAYAGPGRSWTDAFRGYDSLTSMLRTPVARGWAREFLAGTSIIPVECGAIRARMISCRLCPTSG